MTAAERETDKRPWCPVCHKKMDEQGVIEVRGGFGFHTTFAPHGCDGDGRRVKDADYGFVVDGRVVPSWEVLGG